MLFNERANQVLNALARQDGEFEEVVKLFVSHAGGALVVPDVAPVRDSLLLHLLARLVVLEATVEEQSAQIGELLDECGEGE